MLRLVSFILAAVFWPAFLAFAQPRIMAAAALRAPHEKVIGVTQGDFAKMAKEWLRPTLEKKGFKISVIEFSDYQQPNLALADGRVDVNIFQHQAFLKRFERDRRVDLEVVSPVPTAPLGLYGGKIKTLEGVRAGSSVAIPNDPTNLARALTILDDLGWIQLGTGVDHAKVSIKDVRKNPKKVVLIQLEAPQLTGALQDVDFAVVNGNYAVAAGLELASALAREKSEMYINWAVARRADIHSEFIKEVRAALTSKDFQKFARERFMGYQFPGDWKK